MELEKEQEVKRRTEVREDQRLLQIRLFLETEEAFSFFR
jgi:hypothetical protein